MPKAPTAGSGLLLWLIEKATLMTKDVTKEDNHLKYSEIAYQLSKTFTGQPTSSKLDKQVELLAFITDLYTGL